MNIPASWKNARWFILRDEKVYPCDALDAAFHLEDIAARQVAQTDISDEPNYPGGDFVSTVFLGLNHSWREGPPVLFETMVFGGQYDTACFRYTSIGAAKIGHWQVVDCIRAGLEPAVEIDHEDVLFLKMLKESTETDDEPPDHGEELA